MPAAILTSESSHDVDRREYDGRAALEGWWRWLQATPTSSLPTRSDRHASRPDTRPRRVLLISYQFPPAGGSGVQRPAKLAKYLPDHGWSVEVLAAGHDHFCWTDASLLSDLPAEVLTHRVAGWEPACVAGRIASIYSQLTGTDARQTHCGIDPQGRRSSRCIEDALYWRLTGWADRLGWGSGESLWVGPAARAAIARHRRTPFDAVISTGPPHFTHRVALRIAQATDVPWLADLRDPLVSDFDRQQPSPRYARRMRRLEQQILACASAVVTTCPGFALDLQERYPWRTRDIHAITNGFDRDDIRQAIDPEELTASSRDACTIVAAGSFYGRRELARIISPLQQVLDRHPSWGGRVQLIIAGTIDAEQRAALEQTKPPWVTLAGYLGHVEAIRLASSAACNLVVVPACEHGRLSIPGKTFELLALPSHVLALVPPDGDVARIVQHAGGATVLPFENEQDVASALERIITLYWSGQLSGRRDWRQVDVYDRRAIASRFADCLDAMCKAGQIEPA